MKKLFVLALLGVLLFATGCSDCTDWTYTWCDYVKSSEHLVIKTPEGQWTANKLRIYFGPPDYDYFQTKYRKVGITIEAFYPDTDIEKPGHFSMEVGIGFNQLESGDDFSFIDSRYVYDGGGSALYKDYFFDNAEITGGTLKVLALGPKDVHIQIQGLKIKGTPTKGKYAGQAVEAGLRPALL